MLLLLLSNTVAILLDFEGNCFLRRNQIWYCNVTLRDEDQHSFYLVLSREC
jgi:hypothetical protein